MSVSTIIFIALIVWMLRTHTSGRGGCGGHGSHGDSGGGSNGR